MAAPTPNVAGFREAQDRLRNFTGTDVVFFADVEATWPAGTQIDEDTGQPFDPFAVALTSGQASATVRCGVTFRLRGDGEAETPGPAGRFASQHVLLTAPSAAASAVGPTFRMRGSMFTTVSHVLDGWPGAEQLLIYGRRNG